MRLRTVGLAAMAAALLAASTAAAAAPAPIFGLRPVGNPKLGYFVYPLAAGASRTGAVLVTNSGNAAGTVRLYPVDAATGRTSGTVYLTDAKPKRAGAWIEPAVARMRLAPHSYRRVAFTVHVPAGQQAGQWVGGLVAESTQPTSARPTGSKTGVQIKVRNQTIIAVQVDVPGPLVPSFQVGRVTTGGEGGYQDLIVHLANTGNGLAKPSGRAVVRQSGKIVANLPFHLDTFLPQTAIDYPILLKHALAPGSYTTQVDLTYGTPAGTDRTVHASPPLVISKTDVAKVFTSAAPTQTAPGGSAASGSSGSSTPWAAIGGVAAAVIVIGALMAFLLLRRRRGPATAAPAPAAATPVAAAAPAEQPVPLPPVVAEPAAPAPPPPAPTPPRPAPTPPPPPPPAPAQAATARPEEHLWEVAYERGALGDDGIWRFPHRCRTCGLELAATDITDANAQAARLGR